ncbi:MAG: hypothetical protein V3V56_00030 [bacterium]
MASRTPKEFILHLREIYQLATSDRKFVYLECFNKETGNRLKEAYRQLACAYWASAEVHAAAQTRYEWKLDVNTKIKVARQVWEEARHCKDVKSLLKESFNENFDVKNYTPVQELTDCFFNFYNTIEDPGAYFAAHNAAGERTALFMLKEVANMGRLAGNERFASFAEKIIPEERLHVRLGEEIVEKYADTKENQERLERYFLDGLEAHWSYTEGVYRKINSMSA